jgi:hypothetical protein
VTPDHIGELCVVGLKDGRILVRQVQRGSAEGLFNLLSATESPFSTSGSNGRRRSSAYHAVAVGDFRDACEGRP